MHDENKEGLSAQQLVKNMHMVLVLYYVYSLQILQQKGTILFLSYAAVTKITIYRIPLMN